VPLRDFRNRTAVVTGGASGIGFSIAERLLRVGCSVMLVDHHHERLSLAYQRLSLQGGTVSEHLCDVTDREAVFSLAENCTREGRPVHLLVNSAGVSLAGSFATTSLDDLRWVMEVNFWGTVNLCRAFLPLLQQEPEGHILNVCSSFGLLGFANKSGYSASKFAVRGFSEALRMELTGSSTGVTVLYPGPVDTPLVREGRAITQGQREAEVEFLSRRAIPAAYVAQRALCGIQQNRARVLLSMDYLLIDWMTRLSPSLALEIGGWMARRMPF